MKSVKMVLVISEGVLGYIAKDGPDKTVKVCWFVDGFRHEVFLEEDEYVVKFNGAIDVE